VAHLPKLLIVDDHPTTLRMLAFTLQEMQVEVIEASNGREAIDAARNEQPTLILLDIMMPDIDGFEVLSVLKGDTLTQSIPVIFLSGVDDSESKIKGLEFGAVDYINKPFNAEEVKARVATHVKIRELEQALIAKNISLEGDYLRLLSTINEGIFAVDNKGAINFANPHACQLTGYTHSELVGRQVAPLFANVSPEAIENFTANVLNKGDSVSAINTQIMSKSGQLIEIRFSCSPKIDHNELVGAVIIASDRTEEVERERALNATREELRNQREQLAHIERLSTMGEMAAGFAHEVNQPLTAITNYTALSQRLLANPDKHEKLSQVLDKIETQAIRASEVIKRLRSFVAKPIESNKRRVSTRTFIDDVIALAEVDAKTNHVSISVIQPFEDGEITCDPIELQQVLLNLIRNAVESTADAGSDKNVEISCKPSGSAELVIEVRDYGLGITDEAAQELFHPFFTTKTKGMGIGLSVCKTIIEAHEGSINFAQKETGAAFIIKLPRSLKDDNA